MIKFIIRIFICIVIFDKTNGSILNNAKEFVRDEVTSLIEKAGGDSQCTNDLKSLMFDLVSGKRWAWEMLDASAKLQSGIMSGNIFHIGNYDQCLKIQSDNENNPNIQGQYCTVVLLPSANITNEFSFLLDTISLSQWMGIRNYHQLSDLLRLIKYIFGVCVPLSCSVGDLQKIWNYLESTFGSAVHVVFVDLLCSSKGKIPEQYSYDKHIFGFFGFVLGLVVVSTLYDYFFHQDKGGAKDDNYLMIFSVYTNTKRLLSVNDHQSQEQLSCLNGMKVLSMIWILVGHRIMFNIFSGTINVFEVFEWRKNHENILLIGGTLAVDVFLILSGLLLSYLFFKTYVTKKQNISVFQLYFFRFLRLTPALFAMILFYIGVLKYLNDGPAWAPLMKKLSGSCAMNWWSSLLYLTNFVEVPNQCIEHSWYLAVDTQLYFVSPLILFPMVTHPKRTVFFTSLVGVCAMIYAFVLTIQNNYGAIYFEARSGFFKNIYQSTFIRSPAWMVGVFFGYIIFKYPKIRIPKYVNILLWIYALGSMYLLMYSHFLFTRYDYNPVRSGIYNALARPFWGLSLCLMVFSCVNGQGGIVNRFLSHPIFTVLVRLSYSVYLVHMAVGVYLVGSKKVIEHFDNTKNYHDSIGDIVFNLPPALLLYLTFEAPFNNLSKLLTKRNKLRAKSNFNIAKKIKADEDKKYLICVYKMNGRKKKTKFSPKKDD